MKYIIAFDGGGTKTDIAVLNLVGKLVYEEAGKGCNHNSMYGDNFKEVIEGLFSNAMKSLKISNEDIEFVFLGISGADLESDFIKLNKIGKEIFKDIPFKIVNDAWIILRSGLESSFGAVAISGTGTNSAAINKDGKTAILRSLGFTLGNYGGGLDISREALHYAFRADELTNEPTMLQDEIPKIFGYKTMSETLDLFYPKNMVGKVKLGKITEVVIKCAMLGDSVSQDILIKIGKFIGLQTGGVIKQVGLENSEVPVVVGGRVFSSLSPLLLDEFKTNLHRICPKAYIVYPKYKPVIGAFLSALDELNIKQSDNINYNLK